MKLVLAIVNHDDAHFVIRDLAKEGFYTTKLATTGGFLRSGNVTILTGVEDEKVEIALEVIRKASHSRTQVIPSSAEPGIGFYPSMPLEVTVGGATIFVLDVDQFKKY